MKLHPKLKRWLLDKYARDEVVAFARDMLAEQVALNQRLMRESVERLMVIRHLRAQIDELQKEAE